MNRAMILPAAIAAGLHVALLGFKSPPPPISAAPDKPEPITWQQLIVPPIEEEVERVPDENENLAAPKPSDSIAPRGAEILPPLRPDDSREKIVVKPSHYSPGDPKTLIPGFGPGSGLPEGPIDVLCLDNTPRALFRSSPSRPSGLGSASETVTVEFVVGKDGKVAQARIVESTNSSLDDACLRAVKRWRFEPGMRQNVAVAFRMQQTFVFTAHD